MDDFPAAHSMDTEWFAIDDAGHVAVLDSGEGGALPEYVPSQDGGVYELSDALRASVRESPWVDERAPARREAIRRRHAELAARGLYVFDHGLTGNAAAGPYLRIARPLAPLPADALPAELRDRGVRLPGLRFAHRPLLQPVDYVTCRMYTEHRWLSLEHWTLVIIYDEYDDERGEELVAWLRGLGGPCAELAVEVTPSAREGGDR